MEYVPTFPVFYHENEPNLGSLSSLLEWKLQPTAKGETAPQVHALDRVSQTREKCRETPVPKRGKKGG